MLFRSALGMAYEQKARYEEAIVALKKAITLSPIIPFYVSALGHAYAASGQAGEARKILDQLQELSQQRYVAPHEMAMIYIGLGEKDQTFAWLEKAYADRVWRLPFLKVEPRFDNLHSDPVRRPRATRRIGTLNFSAWWRRWSIIVQLANQLKGLRQAIRSR